MKFVIAIKRTTQIHNRGATRRGKGRAAIRLGGLKRANNSDKEFSEGGETAATAGERKPFVEGGQIPRIKVRPRKYLPSWPIHSGRPRTFTPHLHPLAWQMWHASFSLTRLSALFRLVSEPVPPLSGGAGVKNRP